MNALQRLIDDFLRDHPEENYATIARRGGLPRQTVQALAKRARARQTPRVDTISKLAKGLQMPVSVVHEAAGMTAGYGLRGQVEISDERTRLLVQIAEDLDEERLDALYRRARMLREEKREEDEARKRRRSKRSADVDSAADRAHESP